MNIRFSSILDYFDKKDKLVYQMETFYKDVYKVDFKELKLVEIYDSNDNLIIKDDKPFKIELDKNKLIKVILHKNKNNKAYVKITPLKHKALLPYEVNFINYKNKISGNENIDPLNPSNLIVNKRDDGNGLYINCNNPEKLTSDDINKILTSQDIHNKKVFFTFEHNNYDKPFYYGYMIKNVSDEDIYVTVLNLGFQLDGKGCWLGEKEWIDFYNLDFRYDGLNYTDKQKEEFIAYYNFANTYKSKKYQPITYRIPKNKYFYVMGGTTKDSYKHINVFKTANKLVCNGCSNGVVLFDVIGKAKGSFIIYQDPKYVKNNNSHQGYIIKRNDVEYGRQYVGYDDTHGVVDTNVNFIINDLTKNQDLPVKYEVLKEIKNDNPLPYQEIKYEKETITNNFWISHLGYFDNKYAIGKDMTYYKTIDNGKDICIDPLHLDGLALKPNIGNWMVDYIDHITITNQGNNDRVIRFRLDFNGSICAFVRNSKGKVIKNTLKYAIMHKNNEDEEKNIIQPYIYEVVVKKHSTLKFAVDFNLLANSCGCIKHTISLIK